MSEVSEPLVSLNTGYLDLIISRILVRLDNHDQSIKNNNSDFADLREQQKVHEMKINSLELNVMNLQQLHETVGKLNEKVDAWGERFREMEERTLSFWKEFNDSTLNLQQQLDVLKETLQKQSDVIIGRLEREIMEKYGEGEQNSRERYQQLEEELSNTRLKLQIDIERTQIEQFKRMSEINDMLDVDKSSNKRPLQAIWEQIRDLRARLEGISNTDQHARALERLSMEGRDLNNPKVRQETITDITHNLVGIAQDFHASKVLLLRLVANANESEVPVTEFPKIESHITLEKRLNRIEGLTKGISDLSRIEAKLKSLQQTIEDLTMEVDDSDPHSPIKRMETIGAGGFTAASQKQQIVKKLEEHMERTDAKVLQLLQTVETAVSRYDFEQTIAQLQQQLKEPIMRQLALKNEEIQGKILEFETRINTLWRENKESSEKMEKSSTRLTDLINKAHDESSNLHENIEKLQIELHSNFEQKIHALEQMFNKITSEQDEPIQLIRDLRTVQMLQKKEIIEIRDIIESISQNQKNDLFGDISEEESENVDLNELQKVKKTLQFHDRLLRQLGNRFNTAQGGGPLVPPSPTSGGPQLSELEDLKKEMKELMRKQESARINNQRDIELINKIYGVLDAKVGKEDITNKVEKSDMQRAYRMLKRRIDDLQLVIKKSEPEAAKHIEDALFLKKRLDAECASCGQQIPELTHIHQMNAIQGKFPPRSSGYGPGFSRILSSLVQGQDGSFTLPGTREMQRNYSFSSSKGGVMSPRPPASAQSGRRKKLKAKLPAVKQNMQQRQRAICVTI